VFPDALNVYPFQRQPYFAAYVRTTEEATPPPFFLARLVTLSGIKQLQYINPSSRVGGSFSCQELAQ
jgi:hypothetical protein